MLVVILENAEVGPSFAEVPVFLNTDTEKSFLWNSFSTQAAFSPLTFIVLCTLYEVAFHGLPFQRRFSEMNDLLNLAHLGAPYGS